MRNTGKIEIVTTLRYVRTAIHAFVKYNEIFITTLGDVQMPSDLVVIINATG